jgi:hypothetical protein
MQYALLIYTAEDGSDSDPELSEEYLALARRDDAVGGAHLEAAATATTVRVDGGQVLTTDGPFVETKEVLGGFYLIDVPNLDDALEFAAKVPAARRGGAVEIRPLVTR